ncbi:hypothetical protein ACFE04_019462 [Oxalis oulophora]
MPISRDKFIVDNLKTLYLACHETSSITASWCLVLLAMHPDWQTRVRAEVADICKGSFPDVDMLRSMKLAAADDDDDDDDVDLSGEETEEEKKAAEERVATVKASTKKKESGKSSILMDVRPWDDETDMKKLEEAVRSVQLVDLLWRALKVLNQARLEANVRVHGQTNHKKMWPSPYAICYHPLKWLGLGAIAVGIFPITLKALASLRNYDLTLTTSLR